MRRASFIGRIGILVLVLASAARSDDFPQVIDTDPDKSPPMPADQAAAGFKVPDGFHVSVFAAEPDVRNPIASAWDARGRLWIAENYTYAERSARFDLRFRDRVLIFEDADGDGRFDKRTVFTDDVQMLTSVEVGRGGVWLMCPPKVLFIPDRDGDDRPDGPAETVLDGFTVPQENYHNFANGLRWGPDGWLYGRCGASSPGRIGVPGTADADRIPIAGTMWRFDPRSKRFEALAQGTTNPWGHDWDARGELFFINTVNGQLWHSIPGAHYARPHTVDANPHSYALIDQHADHYHWDTAKDWTDSRSASGEHGRLGGGHAHSGVMIYQGTQWPAADRGKLFTLNFHGRRANVERLERSGAGFVGKHEPDRFFSPDLKFRGIDLTAGPDGGVYVLDWSDAGECHDSTGVVRTSGRIFKITYGKPTPARPIDLTKASTLELVGMLASEDGWRSRMARLQLVDRAVKGEDTTHVRTLLTTAAIAKSELRLQALWTLAGIGRLQDGLLIVLRGDENEAVRAWVIRLLTDAWPLDTAVGDRPKRKLEPADEGVAEATAEIVRPEFIRMAREDRSGLVRLTLASTLQRLPVEHRPALAAALVSRAEDANDHDLPLMVWYGLIPVADADPSALAKIAIGCTWPTTRTLIARRLAESLDKQPAPVDALITAAADSSDPAFRADILQGLLDGLRGWRKAPRPAGWEAASAKLAAATDDATRARVRDLGVLFGDGRALDEIRRLALDGKAPLDVRRSALQTLIADRPADLRSICEKLLGVRFLNSTASRGLTLFDDPAIGPTLVRSYKSFHPSERPALIDALVARPALAKALLDGIAAGAIPRGDLSSYQARQIRTLNDADLSRKLAEAWGEIRDTPDDKRAAVARIKAEQTPENLAHADRSRGRALFDKTCAACHTLYGQGGKVGPDLTGAGRDNIDYLLDNIVDPGAVVNAEFRVAVVATTDGRTLNGLVRSPTDKTITLVSQNDPVVLRRDEIEEIRQTPASLMPDGLLDNLTPDQIRDLFGYLMGKSQTALPAAP
ncbi:PVC-type heme-binding CxxCH protein [Paludisphaera rhizosphaerae]|uniref:PVC-type heme-binding CxxCH protein n=1 Tax=Paludisphaera rhizosphaerae TaxID=2711216 RepID=UPI0013EA430D|nr:PVC-type heme-binding CxxCH protein [Paludisphaera rhizosphaerae]